MAPAGCDPSRLVRNKSSRRLSRLLRTVLGGVAILSAYYLVPIRSTDHFALRIMLMVLALALLAAIIVRHLRRHDDPIGRTVLILLTAICTLALAFDAIAATPGQFVGLETRTDALYFTVVTIATIGYGDIHPAGQLARVFVMITIAFQFVFITALVSIIARRVRVLPEDKDAE